MFRFYEENMNSEPRLSARTMSNSTEGYYLWEIQAVNPVPPEFIPASPIWLADLETVFEVRNLENTTLTDAHCGLEPNPQQGVPRERCTCHWHAQTGKRCIHLWALLFYMRLV